MRTTVTNDIYDDFFAILSKSTGKDLVNKLNDFCKNPENIAKLVTHPKFDVASLEWCKDVLLNETVANELDASVNEAIELGYELKVNLMTFSATGIESLINKLSTLNMGMLGKEVCKTMVNNFRHSATVSDNFQNALSQLDKLLPAMEQQPKQEKEEQPNPKQGYNAFVHLISLKEQLLNNPENNNEKILQDLTKLLESPEDCLNILKDPNFLLGTEAFLMKLKIRCKNQPTEIALRHFISVYLIRDSIQGGFVDEVGSQLASLKVNVMNNSVSESAIKLHFLSAEDALNTLEVHEADDDIERKRIVLFLRNHIEFLKNSMEGLAPTLFKGEREMPKEKEKEEKSPSLEVKKSVTLQ